METICGTCHHFQPDLPGRPERRSTRGICTHPQRQGPGIAIVIFAQETRCRRGFGEDDWAPTGPLRVDARPDASLRPPDDVVIDERTSPIDRARRTFPRYPLFPVYVDREETVSD